MAGTEVFQATCLLGLKACCLNAFSNLLCLCGDHAGSCQEIPSVEFVHGWWNILPSAVLNEDVRDDPFEFEVSAVSIKSRPPRRRIAAAHWHSEGDCLGDERSPGFKIRLRSVFGSSSSTTRNQRLAVSRRIHPFPQHFLYFLPLPHGQGSFRPGFDAGARAGAVFRLRKLRYTTQSLGLTTSSHPVISCAMKIDGRTLDHRHWNIYALPHATGAGRWRATFAVAASLGFCRTSIYPWLRRIEDEGWAALVEKIAQGPDCSLTEKQRQRVKRWIVGKDPRQYGLSLACGPGG